MQVKPQITLEATFNEIILNTGGNGQYDTYAYNLAGSVKTTKLGEFVYKLSAINMEKIYRVFDGVKLPKPVVVKGQRFIDELRDKYRNYKNAKSRLRDIMASDIYPLEPNGKFFPYSHQTKIVGSLLADPQLLVGADCGTGKTGSTARAVEILLKEGEIRKGKVLVSAPLSILATSWMDDIKKFTNLNAFMLWTPKSNKKLKLGEKEIIGHGLQERPPGALTLKTVKSQRFVKGNQIKPAKYKLDLFDEAEGGWVSKEVSYKEATMPDGEKFTVGPIYAQTTEMEKTKEIWIQEALNNPDIDLYIINHDGIRIYEEILKAAEFDFVIVDESTKIKSSTSQVFKAHVNISWKAKRRAALSGTPNPNGFIDLWSQYYFLDRGMTLGASSKDFKGNYFTPISLGHFGGKDAIKWELREDTRAELVSRVKGSAIFLKQRDCVDLPPRTDMSREVYMTGQQSKIYLDMEKEYVAEILDLRKGRNLTVEAVNTLTRLMKLRQITSGFVGSEGEAALIEAHEQNPKYKELDDLIENLGDNKIVIACQFKEEIRALLHRYKDLGVAAVYGESKPEERAKNVKLFQETDTIKVMILQPQAAGHGITLTDAHYFAFLSLDYNFEFYYQVGKRIERIGQKNPMFVYHLLAKTDTGRQTIDHDLMDIMKIKSADRDVLFDNNVDTIKIADMLVDRIIARVQQQ